MDSALVLSVGNRIKKLKLRLFQSNLEVSHRQINEMSVKQQITQNVRNWKSGRESAASCLEFHHSDPEASSHSTSDLAHVGQHKEGTRLLHCCCCLCVFNNMLQMRLFSEMFSSLYVITMILSGERETVKCAVSTYAFGFYSLSPFLPE